MNWRPLTDPSRCTKNETSDSRGVLWTGRCQRRSTWATMFCKYSGNGNSTPSVLTVATSAPVDGFSPGSGATLGVVRGAASRLVLSATGGGGAGDTVLFGDLAFGIGAGFSSAGRSTASGALRASSVGSGAATRCTRYVGGTGLRAAAAPATRNNPASACTATVPTRPTLAFSEPRRPRLTARPPPARRRGQRRSRPPRGSPPAPAPPPHRGPDRRPEGTPQWGVWFAQTRETWPGNPRMRAPPDP